MHPLFSQKRRPPSTAVKIIDKLTFFTIIAPLSAVPQIIEIIKNKSDGSISLIYWIFLLFVNTIWMIYGIVHRSRSLFWLNFFWVIMDLAVISLVIVY